MTTTPTIEQMIEASAEAKREIGEWSDDNGDRHPYLNEAQDGITALLRTLQGDDEAIDTMRRAVSHCGHAPHTRAAMRAVLSAIKGEGE